MSDEEKKYEQTKRRVVEKFGKLFADMSVDAVSTLVATIEPDTITPIAVGNSFVIVGSASFSSSCGVFGAMARELGVEYTKAEHLELIARAQELCRAEFRKVWSRYYEKNNLPIPEDL